jgi:hypothetical protein
VRKQYLKREDDFLAQAFDRYIDEIDRLSDEEYRKREGNGSFFSLSSLGNCPRAQVLNRSGKYSRRPRTIDNKRMLHERRVMHDIHEEAWAKQGIALATEVRLTEGLPEGFRGQADAICHMNCDCDGSENASLAKILAFALDAAELGDRETAHKLAEPLKSHKLYVVDRKGVAPGALRYADTFPKYSHVLQVLGYSMALYKLIGIRAIPYIYYVPAGGSGRPLAYIIEPDDELVRREITAMQMMWKHYQETGELPDVKPLAIKLSRKIISRKGRTLYKYEAKLTRDWECNALYCPYCEWDGKEGYNCTPLSPKNESGDVIGTYNPVTEEIYYDEKRISQLGYAMPTIKEISSE